MGPEYSQNWYLDIESLFYCAHESVGLVLRNAIFLVTLGWPVCEINPMPEGNRGNICTSRMSHMWLDFPVMLVIESLRDSEMVLLVMHHLHL